MNFAAKLNLNIFSETADQNSKWIWQKLWLGDHLQKKLNYKFDLSKNRLPVCMASFLYIQTIKLYLLKVYVCQF